MGKEQQGTKFNAMTVGMFVLFLMVVAVILYFIFRPKDDDSGSGDGSSGGGASAGSRSPSPSTNSSGAPIPAGSKCWSVLCEDSGTASVLKSVPTEQLPVNGRCPPGFYVSSEKLSSLKVGDRCPVLGACTPCWIATNCDNGVITEARQSEEGLNQYCDCRSLNSSRLQKVGLKCPDELQNSIKAQHCWKPVECAVTQTYDGATNTKSEYTAISNAQFVKADSQGNCPTGSSRNYGIGGVCPAGVPLRTRSANPESDYKKQQKSCTCTGKGGPCVCTYCVPKDGIDSNGLPTPSTVPVSFWETQTYKQPFTNYPVRPLRWSGNLYAERPKCNPETEKASLWMPGQCIDCLLPDKLISNTFCDETAKLSMEQLIQQCRDMGGTTQGKPLFMPE